jgi:hypothetical protein
VQTFGSSIHGGCQPAWSGTQNRQIVDLSGRLYLNAVCAGNLGEARIVQHWVVADEGREPRRVD